MALDQHTYFNPGFRIAKSGQAYMFSVGSKVCSDAAEYAQAGAHRDQLLLSSLDPMFHSTSQAGQW
jgi:hypothetical protein